MTNTELLDLLREARESFAVIAEEAAERDCDCPPEWPRCELCRISRAASRAQRRIDAALAERQDSAKDVVESDDGWEDLDLGIDIGWMDGAFDGHTTKLGPWTLSTFATGRNEWLSAVAFTQPFATEAEAKSAAIAAARGMK